MKLDPYEENVLAAFESGALISVATREELESLREAARATSTKDQRINIRLSAGDLRDIQAKAMQEGMPYQTLIASVFINTSPEGWQKKILFHSPGRMVLPESRRAASSCRPLFSIDRTTA